MIYKLLHKLFGWDYIYWENSCDEGISRVHVDAEGKVFYWRYKSTRVADPLPPTSSTVTVRWLTCDRSKYLK